MTRAVLFASITSGLTLLASSSFAAGPAMPAADVFVGAQHASATATIRPMPAPGRMATQLPVTRALDPDQLSVLPPIMQSRATLAPVSGFTPAAPVARQPDRLQMGSYWSIGAFR